MTDPKLPPPPPTETFENLSKDEKIRHVILMAREARSGADWKLPSELIDSLSAIEEKLSEIIIH